MIAYEGNEPYVFISYAHKDKKLVLPIIQGLQARGFRVWYDQGIEVGNEWPDFIAEHLENCACVLSFISRNFGESHNCRQEFTFSQNLRKENSVVYLEDPGMLRAGLRMQLSNIHALHYGQNDTPEKLLNDLSAAKVLSPCLSEKKKTKTVFTAESFDFGNITFAKNSSAVKRTEPKPAPARSAASSIANPPRIVDAEAQYAYGYKLAWAEGGKRDNAEAVQWFKLAAAQNHMKAQEQLGYCYMVGKGVKKDVREAVRWYRKAAALGSESAKRSLERCYANYPDARTWR